MRLALNDFGTGEASLSYLLKLYVDKIKIDRAFIQAGPQRKEGRAVVNSIISLARTLGMTVTAEGIETEPQASYLRLQGCDEMQGFLCSRPITAQALSVRTEAEIGTGSAAELASQSPMTAMA